MRGLVPWLSDRWPWSGLPVIATKSHLSRGPIPQDLLLLVSLFPLRTEVVSTPLLVSISRFLHIPWMGMQSHPY